MTETTTTTTATRERAIDEGFRELIRSGAIVFRLLEIDDPKMTEFTERYDSANDENTNDLENPEFFWTMDEDYYNSLCTVFPDWECDVENRLRAVLFQLKATPHFFDGKMKFYFSSHELGYKVGLVGTFDEEVTKCVLTKAVTSVIRDEQFQLS